MNTHSYLPRFRLGQAVVVGGSIRGDVVSIEISGDPSCPRFMFKIDWWNDRDRRSDWFEHWQVEERT